MYGLTPGELKILRALRTPKMIQDFLNEMPMNFEPEGDTCLSPRRVLRERRAHCMEGAMLAAVALRLQGRPPLVVDLKSTADDLDHVIAVFKENNHWGSISKTNHGVLRFREPIYRTVRELAMSFFHEYFLDDGRKTLRSYSRPVSLAQFDDDGWMTAEEDVWYIPNYVDAVVHYPLLSRSQITKLRPADKVERSMGKIVEWKKR